MTSIEIDRLEELLVPPAERGLVWYRATLRQGWKRQLRRMFGVIEAPITRLVRVRIGPVRIDGLRSGKIRPLKAPEVRGLAGGGGRSRGADRAEDSLEAVAPEGSTSGPDAVARPRRPAPRTSPRSPLPRRLRGTARGD
jgi:hypothetical protein